MKKDRVGWVYPTGKIVETKVYGHLNALFGDKKEAKELLGFSTLEEFDEWADMASREAQADFCDSYGDDEHIPWHCFYGYVDDQIRNRVQESGFHRWATYTNKYNEFICVLEGENVASIPHIDVINNLMEFVDCDECHYQWWGWRKTETKKIKRLR